MRDLVLDLSVERFLEIVRELPSEVRMGLDVAAARALNSRPQAMRRRSEEMKVRAVRSWIARKRDDDLAGEILRAYFLGPRKDLVCAFLDATDCKHEDGQVEDDAAPDAGKVPAAIDTLLQEHSAADLRLYLGIAALQWPDNAGLGEGIKRLDDSAGDTAGGTADESAID